MQFFSPIATPKSDPIFQSVIRKNMGLISLQKMTKKSPKLLDLYLIWAWPRALALVRGLLVFPAVFLVFSSGIFCQILVLSRLLLCQRSFWSRYKASFDSRADAPTIHEMAKLRKSPSILASQGKYFISLPKWIFTIFIVCGEHIQLWLHIS